MRILNKKTVASAIAASSIMLNALVPSVYGATLTDLTGNGDGSVNSAIVSRLQNTTVSQTNRMNVVNSINTMTSTGNNTVSGNEGGSVLVVTGDASSKASVANAGNLTRAEILSAAGVHDNQVEIEQNGADSVNDAMIEVESETVLSQDNDADLNNILNITQSTGDNSALGNSAGENGAGSVIVISGNTFADVSLKNGVNAAGARIGRSSAATNASSRILGNGDMSMNSVGSSNQRITDVRQSNIASVLNMVDLQQTSGNNMAVGNMGENSLRIDTGAASSRVGIENKLNFASADISDDALIAARPTLSNNGMGSVNSLSSSSFDSLQLLQGDSGGNIASLSNLISANPDTGNNMVSDTLGAASGSNKVDLVTGNASTEYTIENSGGVISSGPNTLLPLPGLSFDLLFDLSSLFRLLGR